MIVNADDLGFTRRIDDAVFALMGEGRISSATLMANAPDFEYAAERLKQFPRCSFGVHLNATALPPLTRSAALRPILDERGDLSEAALRVRWTPELKKALLQELSAQVERVRAAGVLISHFDSHQHVHTLPPLFLVFKALQQRFGVRRFRISKNLYAPGAPAPTVLRWKKRAYNFALRTFYPTRTTAGFTEVDTFEHLLESGQTLPVGTLELMCHPGTSNPAYRAEEDFLRTPWTEKVPGRAQLISYREL